MKLLPLTQPVEFPTWFVFLQFAYEVQTELIFFNKHNDDMAKQIIHLLSLQRLKITSRVLGRNNNPTLAFCVSLRTHI